MHRVLWIFFIIVVLGIYGLVEHQTRVLPANVSAVKSEFSEARARKDLAVLTEAIGQRLVGMPSENQTISFLLDTLAAIKNDTRCKLRIEIDFQIASGSLKVMNRDIVYTNVSNIVVRISPMSYLTHDLDKSASASFVSSHFDSGYTSPGASDDGVPVVVMLEIIRVLSLQERPQITRPIIFLFNGAEEMGLLAAHAFITQHQWRKTIDVFINLESAGAGGPVLVFQTGPKQSNELLSAFIANAVYPKGCVVTQDVFQTGLIPSDTDFRIYRDFGNLSGIDTAFYKTGSVYHTDRDTMDYIDNGSVKHMGINTLHFLLHLDKNRLITNNTQTSAVVYFDLLGRVMVSYSADVALQLNVSVIVAAVFTLALITRRAKFSFSLISEVIRTAIAFIGLVIATIGSSLALGLALSKLNPMSWFPLDEAFTTSLFSTASLTGFVFAFQCVTALLQISSVHLYFAVSLFWLLFLVLGTYAAVGSTYLAMLVVAALTLIGLFSFAFKTSNSQSVSLFRFVIGCVFLLVPTVALSEVYALFVSSLAPMMGRFGNTVNSDVVMSVICGVNTFALISAYLPLLTSDAPTRQQQQQQQQQQQHRSNDRGMKAVVLFVTLSLAALTAVALISFPYTQIVPKRVKLQGIVMISANQKQQQQQQQLYRVTKSDFTRNQLESNSQSKVALRDSYFYLGSSDSVPLDVIPFVAQNKANNTFKSTNGNDLINGAFYANASTVDFHLLTQFFLTKAKVNVTDKNCEYRSHSNDWMYTTNSDTNSVSEFRYVPEEITVEQLPVNNSTTTRRFQVTIKQRAPLLERYWTAELRIYTDNNTAVTQWPIANETPSKITDHEFYRIYMVHGAHTNAEDSVVVFDVSTDSSSPSESLSPVVLMLQFHYIQHDKTEKQLPEELLRVASQFPDWCATTTSLVTVVEFVV